VCQDAWTSYIHGSLKSLIETGQGHPNAKEGGLNQAHGIGSSGHQQPLIFIVILCRLTIRRWHNGCSFGRY